MIEIIQQSPLDHELVERWLDQGRAEGRAEGQRAAAPRGRRRILEARFGHLPPALQQRLESLPLERLEAALVAAAQATTLEAFQAELERSADAGEP